MSLRIVSGVLRPYQKNGSVTIELKSNSIVSGAGNAGLMYENSYGGSTHYDKEPCSNICIREFSGQPTNIRLDGPFYSGPTTHYENATINWNCSNDGDLIEISYFFAGEE